MKTISVCIPVYNESENLPTAVQAVEELFKRELKSYSLEIVVMDNASTDETWNVVQNLAQGRPFMKGIRFARNFGYQNSIFAGLSVAKGDAVVELDADLEDPPQVIAEFVENWEKGYDVVYGVRAKRFAPWYFKFLFSIFYSLLNRISDLSIPQNAGDFRLLDRRVVEVLKQLPERNLYLRGLVSFVGFKQLPIVYDRHPRISGSSKFRVLHYIVLAVDALTAFSKTPLRMIGVCGVVLFLISTGLGTYYVIAQLRHGTPVQGFTTLVVLTLFLHSVTFMFLGVLGEYLSRVFDDAKGRPRVVIADGINIKDFPKLL